MNIKFVASVLAKWNHVFQASITILDDGVKVKIPGFWKDRETYLTFEEIKGIELNTPSRYSVLSYSTISFFARGIRVEAHGFATSDAKKIKRYVEDGQRGNNKSYGRSSDYRNSDRDKYYSEEESHLDELIRQASSKLQSQMTYYENELIEALVAIEFVDDDDEDAIVEINIKANNARYNIERMYRNNGANWRYNFDATISECHEKADKIIAKQKKDTSLFNDLDDENEEFWENNDIDTNEKSNVREDSDHILMRYNRRVLKAISDYDKLKIELLENTKYVDDNKVTV